MDITDTAGKNAIYYFGRQDKANTFVYGANQRYYGNTQYQDTLQVNTGATVSLANTTLYHDIDTLDATRSKAAVKLTGGTKAATLYGSALNDTLTAGSGGASLYGGKGNDTLYGGNGTDRFYWGTGLGNDVVFNYQSNKDIVTFTSGSLKSGRSSGGDVILTSSAGNTITLKNATNKTILVADTKGKLTRKLYLPTGITYNTNKTAVTIKAPYSGTWNAANFATTVRTVDASQNTKPITIKAGSYNNTIKAGKNGSNIYGQGGNDTIYGGNGKDVVWYGSGDGADTISGFQSGKDILRFYNKAQLGSVTTAGTTVTLKIGSGSVKLAGKTNQRVDITDTAGKNAIYYFGRQDKANTFVYGANQRYYGSAKYKDTLQVNTGATVSLANTALYHDIDTLDATRSKAAVKLTGGTKAATLYGSALNDTLTAGSGGASLYGGKGNDTLYGGNGTDRFYWGAGLGNDTIYNYTSGKDLIIFSAGSLKSGKVSGQDVILTSNTGNTLTLKKAAGKTITIQGSNGKKITKTYSAPTTTSLPAGVTYNSQTMTVKLSTGIVTDFSLSGNDVILKSTVGNIRIANAKDKILSVVNGNGVKATYKVAANIPTTSSVAYNSNRTEVVLGKKSPSYMYTYSLSVYGSQATTLNGTANQDDYISLWGSNNNDTLIAGNGYNTSLCGGYGNDKLYGGSGTNTFYWDNYYGNDVIYNYTKGQDNIRLFNGRIESYTVSGNDVILKSGTATLTVKDVKPTDITVYTCNDVKDTYWYDKKLPAGVTCNNATNTFILTNAYPSSSFNMSAYPTIAKNVDARAVVATYGFILSGDDRDNILYASNSGSSIFTGRGKDTIYFGKGKDTLYWYSYDDDKVVYNYTKGQDKIYFTGSYTYYTSGNDLVLKTTNSTLTLKNTKITDVTIGNIYNSAPLTTNKTSLNYQCDVLAVNTKQQASTASLMPITSQNHNDYLSMSQKLTLAQSGKNKLTV
ncbi:Ca2+-binding protein, RTX toxin-related [Selenomonas ruminantium]|uniref:Ca2+-binding protein, RTX toxin-related n=1 Tax=Selenomonas ruminantium TaxID=971 RepID=A0A1I3EFK0_SELRU|nr:Ca2+-binding protein, RTX toxin-related [Selenomonas ruminantium]